MSYSKVLALFACLVVAGVLFAPKNCVAQDIPEVVPFSFTGYGSFADEWLAIALSRGHAFQQLDELNDVIELMGGTVVAVVIEVDELESAFLAEPSLRPWDATWMARWRLSGYLLVTELPIEFDGF